MSCPIPALSMESFISRHGVLGIVDAIVLFNQMQAAFLRNDNHPGLATVGVLAGGAADYFHQFWRKKVTAHKFVIVS